MTLRLRRRTVVALVALGSVLVLLAAFLLIERPWDDSDPQAPPPAAFEHLEAFQALADEHGDRAAGSTGYEAAAQYVETQLEDAGYETERQYFDVETRRSEFETFNIIAEAEGTTDTVIMLGAHLDGVRDSAAINDNGSGAAALLVAAETLLEQAEPTNTVRFVWWGAEEHRNSPGSRHYVEELADEDPEGLEAVAAYLNFDMVASPNYVIGVYDPEKPGRRGRLEVPDGSAEVMEVFTDYFDAREQPWVGTGWNFDSDQVAFIEAGVPVGGLFTGSTERKTLQDVRLFEGTAGQPRDPNYHSEDDDIDNVDLDALEIMTDAIVHATTTLAEDAEALG
jgi:Zn-dependent M28 family amino/carboxypeptidase